MGTALTDVANALWTFSCFVMIVLGAWFYFRNVGRSMRGESYPPVPAWLDRLSYVLRCLMLPFLGYKSFQFWQQHDSSQRLSVAIFGAGILLGLAGRLWQERNATSAVGH
jgi:membrane protein DedA with SNARE-associated domain